MDAIEEFRKYYSIHGSMYSMKSGRTFNRYDEAKDAPERALKLYHELAKLPIYEYENVEALVDKYKYNYPKTASTYKYVRAPSCYEMYTLK